MAGEACPGRGDGEKSSSSRPAAGTGRKRPPPWALNSALPCCRLKRKFGLLRLLGVAKSSRTDITNSISAYIVQFIRGFLIYAVIKPI